MIDLSKLSAAKLHKVGFRAQTLSECAVIAFWLQNRDPEDGTFHIKEAGRHLQIILDILGLEVVSK